MHHTGLKTVELERFNERHLKGLEDYYLPEDQMGFTAMPDAALKDCEADPGRHPITILHKGEPAGFFVLHEGEAIQPYSANPSAILLRAYSVNAKFQGKGIASRSMELLPGFVKTNFPEKNEIVLAVNHANLAAQHVYKKAGFKDNGHRVIGRKGEQFIFAIEI